MPEFENPEHPAYYDPFNWGDKPPIQEEQLFNPDMIESEIDSKWVTESIAQHLGLMGQ